MGVQPYPYERWPRVRRSDALRLRQLLRGLPRTGHGLLQAEAGALLGTSVRLRAEAMVAELLFTGPAGAAHEPPALALLLSVVRGVRDLPVLCSFPPELAALLVDRVLGGDGRSAHPVDAPLDELAQGVLAYFAARVLAAAGSDLRVQGVVQDRARAAALLGEGAVLALPLALELSGQPAGVLRLLAGEATFAALGDAYAAPYAPREPLSAALRALPLKLCAHVARVSLTRAELAELGAGDVIVPDHCRIARGPAGFAGQVELHVIGGQRARFGCSASGTQIAIETSEHLTSDRMSDAKRIPTQAIEATQAPDPVALAGDAPIELCLELARFSLPLEELSALRPGEVLLTGRPIGERIALSAAGRIVARGELCEVDGEIGVRIVELAR